jgi:prepilin-type N-terminal cleavage/methylation domain-containing protein
LRDKTDRRGFTFIEIMLAIMIVGMVMTSLYGILVSTIRIKKIMEKEMDEVKAGALAFDLIRLDLQSACALNDGGILFVAEAGKGISGGSGAGKIDFVSSIRNRFPDSTVFTGEKKDDDESFEMKCVLVRREDFFIDDDPEKGGVSMKLCRKVKSFEMFFFRGDEADSGEEPLDEWDGEKEESLPFAVKIRLVLDRAKGEEEEREKVFEAVIPLLAGKRRVEEEDSER